MVFGIPYIYTLPETNIAAENRPSQKETIVFQPSIFRGYVSFREGIYINLTVLLQYYNHSVNHFLGVRNLQKDAHESHLWQIHVSGGQNPGWYGYIGDDILPSYMGIITSHDKNPY